MKENAFISKNLLNKKPNLSALGSIYITLEFLGIYLNIHHALYIRKLRNIRKHFLYNYVIKITIKPNTSGPFYWTPVDVIMLMTARNQTNGYATLRLTQEGLQRFTCTVWLIEFGEKKKVHDLPSELRIWNSGNLLRLRVDSSIRTSTKKKYHILKIWCRYTRIANEFLSTMFSAS